MVAWEENGGEEMRKRGYEMGGEGFI